MRSYTSIHGLETTPIAAAASGNDGTEWLTLFLGDHELTVFMPFARAQRLADAINDAEAETATAATAAEIEAQYGTDSEGVVF